MNADDFLVVAKNLASNAPYNEAEGRTAISRAYYAVFLPIRDRMKRNHPNELLWAETPGKGIHFQIQKALDIIGLTFLSDKLAKLCEERVGADYKLYLSIDHRAVGFDIGLAEDIKRLIPNV